MRQVQYAGRKPELHRLLRALARLCSANTVLPEAMKFLHQRVEERGAVVAHAETRMIVEVGPNAGKIDQGGDAQRGLGHREGPMPERNRTVGEP